VASDGDRAADVSANRLQEAHSVSWRLPEVLRYSPVRLALGPGRLNDLGPLARQEGDTRVLLVSDEGIRAAGHLQRAARSLRGAGLSLTTFTGVQENPTTGHVSVGLRAASCSPSGQEPLPPVARAQPGAAVPHTVGGSQPGVALPHVQPETAALRVDFVVALGGGSVMDCAKGINLLYSNGGRMQDYRGDPPPDVLAKRKPLLPMILIPTTAGTGSEAQSFALVSDEQTHLKMACGDRRFPGGLRPRVAILDPELPVTQPRGVAAAAGMDAISHAVETAASTARNERSRELSAAAWQALSAAFPRVMQRPTDAGLWQDMLLGAHLAGAAIEPSMLGAAHACANPLTARFGIAHGVAVGVMLPHVVRFNAGDARDGEHPYAHLCRSAEELARRLEDFLAISALPRSLCALGVPESSLPELAELAATQWTARFNPRRVSQTELLQIYRHALG